MTAKAMNVSMGFEHRYRWSQRLLHWTMAAIIIAALGLGLYCSYLHHGSPQREFLMDLHKSLGMTALALVVMRISTRAAFGEPSWRTPPSKIVRAGSHLAHGVLYLLMVLMPVAGYITSGSQGRDIPWFGAFYWPNLMPANKALGHLASEVHVIGAYTFFAVLGLHLAAVAWHRLVKRDEVLSRML